LGIIFIFFLNQVFERYALSTPATALANAVTASSAGIEAIRFNPAGLDFITKHEVVCNYEWTFSGIEGLHNINFAFACPIALGGIGIDISEFGFAEQKEQAITLAYGRGFSEDFKFGIGANLYCLNNARAKNLGWAYGIDLSLLAKLQKQWSLGVYGHNLNQPQFGKYEIGRLPAELHCGLGYEPFSGIASEIDLFYDNQILRIHTGSEFTLFDFIFIRVGIVTNPEVASGGIGITHSFIKVDYGAEFEPNLPLTHSLSVGFEF